MWELAIGLRIKESGKLLNPQSTPIGHTPWMVSLITHLQNTHFLHYCAIYVTAITYNLYIFTALTEYTFITKQFDLKFPEKKVLTD